MRVRLAAVVSLLVAAMLLSACSGADNCASERENCASAYLQANGADGMLRRPDLPGLARHARRARVPVTAAR